MSSVNVQIEGLDGLRKQLSRMANTEQIEEQALVKSGEHLRDKLEENVYSYGLKRRSGRSEKSFVLSRKVVQGRIYVGLSNQNNDAFYLYFHEFGTSKMPARPFFRPTFEQEKPKIERIMAEEVRRGLGL